jgi:hypothetical protein
MKHLFCPQLFLVGTLFLAGCSTEYIEIDRTVPPYFHARNVFHAENISMPHRVLVLPTWGKASVSTLRDLDPILIQEVAKINLFEVATSSKENTVNRRPEQDFTLEEARAWARQKGADGILMCQVTSSNPYRPTSLGVKLRLWSVHDETTVWAVDETLDSQLTTVANGARNYYLTTLRSSYPTRRSEQILESPRLFYQYVFAELLSSLPEKPSKPPLSDEKPKG